MQQSCCITQLKGFALDKETGILLGKVSGSVIVQDLAAYYLFKGLQESLYTSMDMLAIFPQLIIHHFCPQHRASCQCFHLFVADFIDDFYALHKAETK